MTQQEVQTKVVEILRPFVKSNTPAEQITMETSILKDLKVNSARLVDIVLEIEEADQVKTVGDAVNLILKAKS
jgi:acyl carrier protein